MQKPTIDDAILEISKRFQPDENTVIKRDDLCFAKYISYKIYLLEALNNDYMHKYIWFHRPVCTDLTDFIWSHLYVLANPKVSINPKFEHECDKINTLVQLKPKECRNDEDWFRLLASVHFLNKNNDSLDLTETRKWLKHYFGDNINAKYTYNILHDNGFFNNTKD